MKKIIKTIITIMSLLVGFTLQSCGEKLTGKEMVKIPGKNFMMAKTEVTQELYESVMGKNPSFFQVGSKWYESLFEKSYEVPVGEDSKRIPVEFVTWYDAVMFCNKLSEKEGLKPAYSIVDIQTEKDRYADISYIKYASVKWDESANGYRLPTMEEWGYAVNEDKAYFEDSFRYSGSNNLDEVGWYDGNSADKTHEVAIKKPNVYGIFDMNGNVDEWCWDFYNGGRRYVRGGSYKDSEGGPYWMSDMCYGDINKRAYSTGFRLCRNKK